MWCRRLVRSGMVAGALPAAAGFLAPAQPAHAQDPVTFTTADEGFVSAGLYGSGLRGVVLVPGGRFDKSSWESEARVLVDAGFLVLAISSARMLSSCSKRIRESSSCAKFSDSYRGRRETVSSRERLTKLLDLHSYKLRD